MLAKNNEYLQEAADSLYLANSEEIIRQKCQAREDAERHERTIKRDMRKLQEEKEQLALEKEQLKAELSEMKLRLQHLEELLNHSQK